MFSSLAERKMVNALQEVFSNNAVRVWKCVNKIAAKQGGASTIENYQLLGKRAFIVLGVGAAATSAVSYVISRRREEQRIEKVVRRVLEEEQQKAEATE